jgi:regulator of cell morphogenesis and NO signaling
MQSSEHMTSLIDPAAMTLGEIAVSLPGATAVFDAVNLDYCCGGQLTLKDAATAASLDLELLIATLAKLKRVEAPTSADLDTPTLVDTIITRYHRVHSQELPELIRLAEKVEQVHRGHPVVPAGLAALLKHMLGELTIHMQKEELMLFPRMRNGASQELLDPISVMMVEHVEHGAHLQALKNLTNNMQTPEDGCATWRALYAGITKFAGDLVEHIHTENNILFPRFQHSNA